MLAGSKYFVLRVYGEWVFLSTFGLKDNSLEQLDSEGFSFKNPLKLMHIASEVNIDFWQDGRDISNISSSFSVALIDTLSCV